MKTQLTAEQLKEIALGYIWDPSISYENFLKENNQKKDEDSYILYIAIDERYCEFMYEKEFYKNGE